MHFANSLALCRISSTKKHKVENNDGAYAHPVECREIMAQAFAEIFRFGALGLEFKAYLGLGSRGNSGNHNVGDDWLDPGRRSTKPYLQPRKLLDPDWDWAPGRNTKALVKSCCFRFPDDGGERYLALNTKPIKP